MIQPQNYPRLIGQALVLEPDPFVEMVDDDNPWVEGLFLLVVLGVLVGLAKLIGSVLLTNSLPDPNAILETVLAALGHLQNQRGAGPGAQMEESVRQIWGIVTSMLGYGTSWQRLSMLVLTPLSWLLQWFIVGVTAHLVARVLGGTGSLNQTLGATALASAPRVLLLVSVIPFTQVSGVLLGIWGLLILYRALQVTHDLPYKQAIVAAVAPLVVLAVLAIVGVGVVAFGLGLVGGLA
jgi:hypothetical protein